ncbi:MAG: SDR family NAD(P)-dependent oxidoreductase [Clostridiales bacterium]|nr:SDR family NAD(P)-dependent oxidoreductase [Clostridiales bacterium]
MNYLVTGANGGMGRAICRALTDAGHRVWGIDRAVSEEDIAWQCFRADVTDMGALEAMTETIRQEAGQLDGIVHAAGVYDLDSLVEIPEERFLRDFDVNLFGIYRVNRVFLPLLAPGGRIVMISSELGPLRPLPFTGIYAITKGAVEKYAYSLRMELQVLDHPVIVIRPGAVDTGMLPASQQCLDRFCEETKLYRVSAERFRNIVGRVEAKRVPPEKVAEKVRKTLETKKPRMTYSLNRSPLLRLFNLLPDRAQLKIIRKVIT